MAGAPLPERPDRRAWRGPAFRLALGLAALAAFAAMWRWTPLRQYLDPPAFFALVEPWRHSPAAPVVAVVAFIVGSLVMVPLTAMILVAGLLFGPWLGFLCAYAGTILGAVASYWIGRLLWLDAVRRLAGDAIDKLAARLEHSGIAVVAALRVVPVAPFTVFNLVSGAWRVRFRDYLLGTMIAMLPITFAMTVFADRIADVLKHPSAANLAVAALVVAVVALAGLLVSRALGRRAG